MLRIRKSYSETSIAIALWKSTKWILGSYALYLMTEITSIWRTLRMK